MKERLIYLDIIRIFACLCVLVIHFNACVSGYDIFVNFHYPNHLVPNYYFGVSLGNIGVGLFFILSGAGLQYANGVISLKFKDLITFFKKRFLSLYPAFWITFTFFTLFSFLYNLGMPKIKLGYFLASIFGLDAYLGTLTHNPKYFATYQCGEWFLGCILLIYLIFPLLSYFFNKFPKTTSAIAVMGYVILCHFHINEIWFFMQIPYLILGMIFIKYFRTALSLKLWIPTILAICVKIFFGTHLTSLTNAIILCWFIFLLITLLVELFNKRSDYLKQESVAKFIGYVGVLTYPMFLFHHKLITLLCQKFDLANFPYRYTVTLFIIYMIVTVVFSIYKSFITPSLILPHPGKEE